MIRKFKGASLITAITILVGIIALLHFEPNAQIPIHWNAAGEADNHTAPLHAFSIMPLIQILMLFVFSKLHFFEPRGENLQKSWKAVVAIVTAVFALLAAIQTLIFAVADGLVSMNSNIVFAMMGIMFMIIGNYFGKLHSTFFIGLRTPWTLSSETVWRKTHRLGGKLFVGAGLFLLLSISLIEGETGIFIGMSAIAVGVVVPLVYSWWLWLQEKKDASNS